MPRKKTPSLPITTTLTTILTLILILSPLAQSQSASASASASNETSNDDHEQGDSFIILLLLGLLITTLLFGYGLRVMKFAYLHDSGVAIILGCITAALVRFLSSEERLREALLFDPELFLLVLLPPIIFESGYNMKRDSFFSNMGSILTYAFIGTPLSTFITAGLIYLVSYLGWTGTPWPEIDCLIFGALISATDPVSTLSIFSSLHVDKNLYANVFGESVMNDAVAIVLFRTLIRFVSEPFTMTSLAFAFFDFFKIFFGSILISLVIGVLSALLFKYTTLYKYPTIELILLILYAFASYVLAEGLKLSGIVAVLFAGIFMGHYTSHNLSKKSETIAKRLFHVIAVISETFVFVYLGFAIFSYDTTSHDFEWSLILLAVPIILFSRAVNIFPLTLLVNCFKSDTKKIRFNEQIMMWFSGLRGAIAFALALQVPTDSRVSILTTTLIIVVITVLIFGGLTIPMLRLLKIKMGENTAMTEDKAFYKSNRCWRIDRSFFIPLFTKTPKFDFPSGDEENNIQNGEIILESTSSSTNDLRTDSSTLEI